MISTYTGRIAGYSAMQIRWTISHRDEWRSEIFCRAAVQGEADKARLHVSTASECSESSTDVSYKWFSTSVQRTGGRAPSSPSIGGSESQQSCQQSTVIKALPKQRFRHSSSTKVAFLTNPLATVRLQISTGPRR